MSGRSIFEIKTLEDMERYYYGLGIADVMKADAPILTTQGGIYNPIYGAKVWSQLNLEANTFAFLPKAVWDHSGFRVLTARAPITGSYTVAPGGLAEGSALPDTTKPAWKQLYSKPKIVGHTFNVAEMIQYLGGIDDSLGDVMRQMREYMGLHHAEHINIMLNAEGVASTAVQEGNDIQTIDRIVSAKVESDGTCFMADGSSTPDVVSNDVYVNGTLVDRSDATNYSWADAIISYHATKGSLRSLTLDLLDDIFRQIWKAGGTPKIIQTGYDTLKAVQRLLQAQQRFVEYKTVVPTYGGVRGIEGIAAGFIVATYNGVPILPTKNNLQDKPTATPAGLSRLYFLDTDYLLFKVAKPTQYFEAGISTGNPFAINFIGDKGLYRTMGDVICTRFNVQGKIRDLKE
jgi:hypothetical protein